MIPERYDYSILLAKLKNISENFSYDDFEDIVWNKKARQEEKDERIIANVLFGNLYCMAYLNLVIKTKNDYGRFPLDNTNIFNYFINVCLNEYKIYGDIGTGKVTYAPYQELADYILLNPERKKVFMDYLMCEKEIIASLGHDVLGKDKEKSL